MHPCAHSAPVPTIMQSERNFREITGLLFPFLSRQGRLFCAVTSTYLTCDVYAKERSRR